MSKIWYANDKFSLWKILLFDERVSKMLFFIFSFFNFSKLQMTNVKNLFLKPSFFKIDFDGSYEVLLRHKYFWFTYF